MIRSRSRGSWMLRAALVTLLGSALSCSEASCTEATRCMDGVSQNGHGPARPVGPRRKNCKEAQLFVQSSCIWYYWECLMQRVATDMPMSTSMILRPTGGTINQSSCCMLPASPCTHRTWQPSKTGVNTSILHWRISSGLLGPLAGMPVAPELWTHWISMLRDFGAGGWELSAHVKSPAWLRTLHITRLWCLGRRVRWWRCRPQAFQRRIKSRRRRKQHHLSPQVGWLLMTALNELLLGHHLDALCALLVSGLSATSGILLRHFGPLTWSSSRQQACAACISLPCMPTLCSRSYASGLPSPATYPRSWLFGVRHRLLGPPLVGPIWLPIHHPRSIQAVPMWFLSYLEVASLPTVGCLSMDLHDDVLEEALADRAT